MANYREVKESLDQILWEQFPKTRAGEGEEWATELLSDFGMTQGEVDSETLEARMQEILADARETALITQYERGYRDEVELEEEGSEIFFLADDWAERLAKNEPSRWKELSEEDAYWEGIQDARKRLSGEADQ